jgi:hypothetical protein
MKRDLVIAMTGIRSRLGRPLAARLRAPKIVIKRAGIEPEHLPEV